MQTSCICMLEFMHMSSVLEEWLRVYFGLPKGMVPLHYPGTLEAFPHNNENPLTDSGFGLLGYPLRCLLELKLFGSMNFKHERKTYFYVYFMDAIFF